MRERSNLAVFIRPDNHMPAQWGIYSILDAQWLTGAFKTEGAAKRAALLIDREASQPLAMNTERSDDI